MLTRSQRLRLCRVRDELSAPWDRPRSVHAIARAAGMSTGQLIRLFAAVFGETPHQRRIGARIARAKELLAFGELSVTQVCLEVGFTSPGSFSDLFVRRVGVPPSVYRRQTRALVQVPADLSRVLSPGCFSLMAEAFAQFSRSDPRGGTPSSEPCGSSSAASWSTTRTRRSPSTRMSSGS